MCNTSHTQKDKKKMFETDHRYEESSCGKFEQLRKAVISQFQSLALRINPVFVA